MGARTRIAPSPTGAPHVGTAYQALFSKALAVQTGGQFLLRIEDTDQSRKVEGAEEAIKRSLRWLGLDWDEGPDVGGPHGPYRQSERLDIYREHAERLEKSGAAYWSDAPPKQQAEGEEEEPSGSALRLRIPEEGQTRVVDQWRGEVTFENSDLTEPVLLKSDGFPTYHLAVVVDDHLMGITHVLRGEEWLPSLPKHVRIYEALGYSLPLFHHTPLLRNADKSKLSKRKNPVSLDWFREQGNLPEALVNFLGILGWSHPEEKEHFDFEEFCRVLDLSRISLSGPIFDLEKLAHLNGLWIRSLSTAQLVERLRAGDFTTHAEVETPRLEAIAALVQERIEKLSDFDDQVSFFFEEPQVGEPEDLLGKKATPEGVKEALGLLSQRLGAVESWELASVEAAIREAAGEASEKTRNVFMALRIALTGRKVSTPLFETADVLGRETTLARLDVAAGLL
ncbi:MAG: glutamate--tRNA ligase [Acidobacteriota bacterium]